MFARICLKLLRLLERTWANYNWFAVKYLMDRDKQRLTQEAAEYRTSLRAIEGDLKRSATPIMELQKLVRKLHAEEMPLDVQILSQELDGQISRLCDQLGFSFKTKDENNDVLQLQDRQGVVLVEWDRSVVEDEPSVR